MTAARDGGPAFPVEVDSTQPHGRQTGNTTFQTYGMSLRDHFAGLAMQAYAQGASGMGNLDRAEVERQFYMLAEFAYMTADSMLAARSAGAPEGGA